MSIFSIQLNKILEGDISISQLAIDTGITRQNLHRIKNGADPSFHNAVKIASACKKQIDFFAQTNNDYYSEEEIIGRIIKEFDTMTIKQRNLFFEFVLPTYLLKNKYKLVSHSIGDSNSLFIVSTEKVDEG